MNDGRSTVCAPNLTTDVSDHRALNMDMDLEEGINLSGMVETIIKEEPVDAQEQSQDLFRQPHQVIPEVVSKTEDHISFNFNPKSDFLSSSVTDHFSRNGITISPVILQPKAKPKPPAPAEEKEITSSQVIPIKVSGPLRSPDYYMCMICSTGIPDKEALRNHDCSQQKIPKQIVYACEHCTRVFAHPASLKRHETVHQNDSDTKTILIETGSGLFNSVSSPLPPPRRGRPARTREHSTYKCKYCSAEFNTSAKLSRHENSHGRKYICPVCSVEFPSSMSWRFHVEKTHGFSSDGETSATGSAVSENSANGENLERTRRTKIPKSENASGLTLNAGAGLKVKQEPSAASNATGQEAQAPEDTPEEDMPFNMESFMTPQVELKVEPDWTCETCQKTFPDFNLLQQHGTELCGMLSPPDPNPNEYKCHICPLSFRLHYDLMKHLDIHSSQKPFQCPQCPSKFSRLQCLTRHSRVHGPPQTESKGSNIFNCTYCKESFSQRATFIKHQLIHTGERPYECSYCQARFRLTSHLNRHVLLHTGQKSFVCRFCPERFTQSISLQCHERKHTGERPFACRYCPSRFRLSAHCKRHEQAHEAKGETEILLSLRMDMNENEELEGQGQGLVQV